jgi:hypothetical protein
LQILFSFLGLRRWLWRVTSTSDQCVQAALGLELPVQSCNCCLAVEHGCCRYDGRGHRQPVGMCMQLQVRSYERYLYRFGDWMCHCIPGYWQPVGMCMQLQVQSYERYLYSCCRSGPPTALVLGGVIVFLGILVWLLVRMFCCACPFDSECLRVVCMFLFGSRSVC